MIEIDDNNPPITEQLTPSEFREKILEAFKKKLDSSHDARLGEFFNVFGFQEVNIQYRNGFYDLTTFHPGPLAKSLGARPIKTEERAAIIEQEE